MYELKHSYLVKIDYHVLQDQIAYVCNYKLPRTGKKKKKSSLESNTKEKERPIVENRSSYKHKLHYLDCSEEENLLVIWFMLASFSLSYK